MFWRLLLLVLVALWIVPRLRRALGPRRGVRPTAVPPRAARPGERYNGLTEQDISDADFEEIPPHE